MIIGCDVDGVLADFNEAFIARVVKVTGRNLFPEGYEPHTWDYPEALGYTKDETTQVWTGIQEDRTFWSSLLGYEGAMENIERLINRQAEGDDVYFITSRPGILAKRQTEEWLSRRGFPRPTVLISSDKGRVAKALKLNRYIDDRTENAISIPEETRSFLLTRPWNIDHELPERVTRIHRFKQFLA